MKTTTCLYLKAAFLNKIVHNLDNPFGNDYCAQMKIFILLPYAGGSHEYWAQTIIENSHHQVTVFKLPGRYWKWRMHGAASYFAQIINQQRETPDIFLATSMMNIVEFRGLLHQSFASVPLYLYFHENQFAYPISSKDPDRNSQRLEHFQFIQLQSFIAADKVFFNSRYNQQTFLEGAHDLLRKLPDYKDHLGRGIKRESSIWPIYIETKEFSQCTDKSKNKQPVFIWNHRWEEDKNPEEFFNFLKSYRELGHDFKLIVCGKESSNPLFSWVEETFKRQLIHFGEAKTRVQYLDLLAQSTHSILTSYHDFYGLSAIELVLSKVNVFFPNRLAYPEHFDKQTWQLISYNKINDVIAKLNQATPKGITNIIIEKNKLALRILAQLS